MDAGVDGRLVHHHVKLGLDVSQRAVVSEAAPLCVDAHPPGLALHPLHVLHLLHVAGVGSRSCRRRDARRRVNQILSEVVLLGICYFVKFNLLI